MYIAKCKMEPECSLFCSQEAATGRCVPGLICMRAVDMIKGKATPLQA
jgi:hypothetical protein